MSKTNPYSPPRSVTPLRPQRTFQIGNQDLFTLVVTSSFWTGIHCAAFDAAGKTLAYHRGTGSFIAGEAEVHRIAIATDQTARIQLFVDNELVEGNLFPHARRNAFLFVGFFIGLVILLLTLLAIRFL